MNFYQLNSVMNGEKPYELKPLTQDDMLRAVLDPEVEEEMIKQADEIQTMDFQSPDNVDLIPMDPSFEVGVRPSYDFDKFGTPYLRKKPPECLKLSGGFRNPRVAVIPPS